MKNRNTKRIILVLLILLILTGMGYLTLKNQYLSNLSEEEQAKVEELTQEVTELETSVNELDALFESSSQELGRRNELLKEKYAEINILTEKLDQLKRSGAAQSRKVKELEEKLSNARAAILEAFVSETDDLKQENQALRDSMAALQVLIESGELVASSGNPIIQPTRIDTVTKTQTTVREATPEEMRLRASNFSFFNIDRNGKGEIISNSPVKKIQELRFCFDILPNPAAEKKIREVYLVYSNPSGTVQHARGYSGTFAHEGNILNFTTKTTVNYRGDRMEICIPYRPASIPLEKGTQTVTVYNDGNVIGRQQFSLR